MGWCNYRKSGACQKSREAKGEREGRVYLDARWWWWGWGLEGGPLGK